MPSTTSLLVASALAFGLGKAHMVMSFPPPYGSPSNGPLEPAQFPCKSPSNQGATVTEMAIGSTQKLTFTGSAVHGGGSCQLAISSDSPATKSSKWQVIHSIEGGCPSKSAGTQNKGDDPNSKTGADEYPFQIPTGVKPGAYTFAWTWYNKMLVFLSSHSSCLEYFY